MESHNENIVMFCHNDQKPEQTNMTALDSGIGVSIDFGYLEKHFFLRNLLRFLRKPFQDYSAAKHRVFSFTIMAMTVLENVPHFSDYEFK